MEVHNQSMPQKFEDDVATRRSFLRRVGMTLAIGLGVALVPSRANANTQGLQQCCRQSCTSCPSGQVAYHCLANGGCPSCCICNSDVGNCFDSQFCIC